jgi:hypothetical protein
MAKFYGATSLTGGGGGALDKISGAILADGDGAAVIIDGQVYIYHLDATSGASESSPAVIAPDTSPGTKRWILVGITATTMHFPEEFDNGNSGAADTIDWSVGNKQKSTLTGNCTFTFSPEPSGPCDLTLRLIQDATGGRTVTWPADVKWQGSAPTINSAADAVTVIHFYYDGADFRGFMQPAPGGAAGFDDYCRLSLSADQTGIVTSTWTQIAFNTEDYDGNDLGDVANNQIKIKTAGYYTIGLHANLENVGDAKAAAVIIHHNTSTIAGDSKQGDGTFTYNKLNAEIELYLAVDDYIEAWVFHDAGANRYLESSTDGGTRLWVHRFK